MRRSIGRKLVVSYLLLILFTLVVSGALFYALVKQYAVSQAKDSLHTEAQRLIQFIEENGGNAPLKKQLAATIALRLIESNFVMVLPNQQVTTSSSQDIQPGAVFPDRLAAVFTKGAPLDGEISWNGKDLVYVALPAYSLRNSKEVQALVLYTDIQQIQSVTKGIFRMLWRGFLITAAVMLLVAFVMMRSLTRPVQILRQGVLRLSRRDFTPPEVLTTGDELEELSRAFRDMTVELKQYDEGQRRFLQNASHELKTPLMTIQGYAEGIRDGIFTGEDADRVLDVISEESIRLKKLVDELIYLSKLETMDDIYNRQRVNLRELAEESIMRVEPLAIAKGVEIILDSDDSLTAVLDPDKIMQALINLMSNGIRHATSALTFRIEPLSKAADPLTAAGGGRQPARHEWVQLVIEDDGPGFLDGEKEQIFERFFRGDKGETGLGLAITKAIVEKSGGSIRADNRPGGGAVFTLELPVR